MKLLSVNVALPREAPSEDGAVTTGIFKEPVARRVMLRKLNLDGDGQADLQHHGGIYQAVYAYTHENSQYWARELRCDGFPYGQFGENFTVEGMPEDAVSIGDVFRIGTAVVEVTQPRVPCYKLGLKMGSAEFPKRFLTSGRVGFYLRVVEEGEVGAGDVIERIERASERLTVLDVIRLAYLDREDREMTRKAARLPALSPEWRHRFETRLVKSG
jgi:MOSC domain-containing protein YiiM